MGLIKAVTSAAGGALWPTSGANIFTAIRWIQACWLQKERSVQVKEAEETTRARIISYPTVRLLPSMKDNA